MKTQTPSDVLWSSARVAVVALLAALCGGCFGDTLRQDFYLLTGTSEGTLVANIGMALSEVQKRSTLDLEETFHSPSGMLVNSRGGLFDFEVAGTGLRIAKCRFYWLFTKDTDDTLNNIIIYVTGTKLSRGELESRDRDLRQRLAADGWLAGRLPPRLTFSDDPFKLVPVTIKWQRSTGGKRYPAGQPRSAGAGQLPCVA